MQPNNPQRPNPAGQRPQFFDVVRPGRTPASPNSRPVLASNRPPVQDASMMKMGAPAVPANLMTPQPAALATPAPRPTPTPTPPVNPQPVVLATPQLIRSMPAAQRFTPSPLSTLPAQQPAQAISTPESAPSPTQEPQATHQKHSVWSEVLAVLAIVLLVAIILNILLDAEIINLPLPHTNFFDY